MSYSSRSVVRSNRPNLTAEREEYIGGGRFQIELSPIAVGPILHFAFCILHFALVLGRPEGNVKCKMQKSKCRRTNHAPPARSRFNASSFSSSSSSEMPGSQP